MPSADGFNRARPCAGLEEFPIPPELLLMKLGPCLDEPPQKSTGHHLAPDPLTLRAPDSNSSPLLTARRVNVRLRHGATCIGEEQGARASTARCARQGMVWASGPAIRGWCREARAGAYRSPVGRVNGKCCEGGQPEKRGTRSSSRGEFKTETDVAGARSSLRMSPINHRLSPLAHPTPTLGLSLWRLASWPQSVLVQSPLDHLS